MFRSQASCNSENDKEQGKEPNIIWVHPDAIGADRFVGIAEGGFI